MRAGAMAPFSAKPDNARNRMERAIRIAPMPQIDIRGMMGAMDSPRALMYWKSSTLGVEAESLDNQLAEFFGVKQGVLVRSVGKETPAEKAGIKTGDVIVKVEETKVGSPREVTSAVRAARNSSKTVNLTVVREKREMALKVTFEEMPANPMQPPTPRTRSIQNKMQEQ
jgi:serine protease Do